MKVHNKIIKAFGALLIAALLFAALPAGEVKAEAVDDRETVILDAADWIVVNQNTDGGFPWILPSTTSTTNTLGVTAIGVLKAHTLEEKTAYEESLAKAYNYVVNNAPVYEWDETKYTDTAKGIDSFPDFTFLIWLAERAQTDSTLLAAINDMQEPDITAADIANLARTRWDDMVLYVGSSQETPANGTATLMAKQIRDVRHAASQDSLIPWDLEAAVKAVLVLEGYFSGQGYAQQAVDIAAVIDSSIDDGAGTYFSSTDTTQTDYVIGLTGAIEAFVEVGGYETTVDDLKAQLLSVQQPDGSWMWHDASAPSDWSTQSTAYAIMALFAQGDEDALTAARKGADFLVKNQTDEGGWLAETDWPEKVLEVDSEAVWALATLPATVTIGDLGYYLIQSAVDSASDGDTILVGPGTYAEALELRTSNITVRSTDGADFTIIDVPDGSLTTGVKLLAGMGTVTFDGFTVKDFTEGGIIQGMSASTSVFHVLNNKVIPAADYLRNGIQVSGDGSTVKGNFVEGAFLTPDWGSTGILAVNASDIVIESNEVSGDLIGLDMGIGILNYSVSSIDNIKILNNAIHGADYSLDVSANSGTISGVVIQENKITDYIEPIWAGIYGGGVSVAQVDATFNWWGSACGPTGPVTGDVVYSPWYTDDTMTTTASGEVGAYVFPTNSTTDTMNAIIACAAPESTLTFEGGTYPGGLVVDRDGLTFELNGATIGHGSSAFEILADNITINGPGVIDGTGSVSTDYAILVQDGADNLIVDGVEVRNWTEAINVLGSHESFKLVNSWVHSNTVGFLTDSESLFTGVVTIEGNLFKANSSQSFIHNGAEYIDATYNSWGADTGPVVSTDVVGNVYVDPWVFSEIYLDMEPGTIGDQYQTTVSHQNGFEVAVMADAENLSGLSFVFEYDTNLLVMDTNPVWTAPWDTAACEELDGLTAGQVGYRCNFTTSDFDWDGGEVARFTFHAIDSGKAIFDILHEDELQLSSGALGGVKIWVNNAGFNDPSTPDRDVTDTNDGEIDLFITQFTGFVDLQGRPNDSGAFLTVYDDSLGTKTKATAQSASSGKYTTAYDGLEYLVDGATYYIRVDRALFLPTAYTEVNLTTSPLTSLAQLLLLGGDGTDNNVIDISDASCIGNAYGGSTNMCTGGPGADSDVNGDGIVNIYDLTLMGGNFEVPYSPWSPQP